MIYRIHDNSGNDYALKLYYPFRDPRDEPNAEAPEIVFHNLIENALYELPSAGDDSRLEIVAGMESSEILSIVFSNPYNPANPKKKVSTGYGLAIAEYLITKFSAILNIPPSAKYSKSQFAFRLFHPPIHQIKAGNPQAQ